MGILNLHKFLERCSSRSNLSGLRGQVVGVDAMCWLHRGSIASAWELLTGRDTDKFLRFFVKMLVLCNMCGVKPVIVFDGASLPAKAKEEKERRERRALNTSKAKEEIESRKITGFGQVDAKLRSMIVQSVSITPEMITRTMSVLRRLNVDFIVAPYEADAQLAYMYRKGVVTGVVSEDSDLIAFGCHRLLSKMDINGDFVDVRLDWAFKGSENNTGKPDNIGELGKLEKWTESMFVDLCILSGSDYKFGKIAGVGIKKAFALLNRFRGIERIAEETAIARKWAREQKDKFLKEFRLAKMAFQHHRVFDVKKCLCITISDDGETVTDETVVGPEIDASTAKQIMTGEIDAKTGLQRVFLDKLPPGVLGVYTSSLRDKENRDSMSSQREPIRTSELSAYELLEQQIVADFEKHQRSTESVQQQKMNYLNKLQGMILSSSVLAVADDEFVGIEDLLDFEESTLTPQELDDTVDLTLLGDDEEVAPPPQPVAPVSKVKNPFAKATGDAKRPRVSEASVASALPAFSRNSNGSSENKSSLMNVLRRSSVDEQPRALVTSRDLVSKKPINKFFARSR